jgi:hypothetical protein
VFTKDGHWLWIPALEGRAHHGYGPYRRVYTLFVGPIPQGATLLHKCTTPACVNPSHMKIGTQKENMDQMLLEDRSPHAKLTVAKVLELRADVANGMSYATAGRKYDISAGQASGIANRRSWKGI